MVNFLKKYRIELDIICLILCVIIIHLYYAPILFYEYSDIDLSGYWQFIDTVFGRKYSLFIDKRAYWVALHSNIVVNSLVLLVFSADILANLLNKEKRIILWIFCLIALVMMIYVTFVAAPTVIDYYYEEHLYASV